MKSWLKECELNHPYCKPNIDGLPKRLIRVGSPTEPYPRLVYTQDLDPRNIRYASLSYCWGKSKTATTTKTTEVSYLDKISLESLPQTIRDALTISQKLNIPYLWVDALCIVQDDEHDWQLEASKMANIYFGNTLTIAATDAEDSSGGFFACPSTTDAHESNSDLFVIGRPNESNLHLQIRLLGGTSDGKTSVLHTRGWTLQEMVLSHRIVQFTQSELHWRCRSAWWTESGMSYDLSSTIYGNVPLLDNINLSKPSSTCSSTWWKWIENYSNRHLTYVKDRIPAIVGLLNYYQKLTDDVSILGLWKSTLPQDLLWMRLFSLPDSIPDSKIPTWSWLSCPAGVVFDFFSWSMDNSDVQDHITVNDYELCWTGEPYVSDIKSSSLVITGPVKEAFLEIAREKSNPPYFNVDHEIPNFAENPLPWRCAAQFDRECQRSPGKWLCLLIRTRVVVDTGYRSETFLILEQVCTETDKETFRRIGLGSFRGYNGSFDLSIRRTINFV